VEGRPVRVRQAAPGARPLKTPRPRPAASLAPILAASIAVQGCGLAPRDTRPGASLEPGGRFHFVEVGRQAGLDRPLHAGRPDKDHLLDSAGFGAAWLDYDTDGWLDAYVVNGYRVEGGSVVTRGKNALYRNRGDGTFEDATDRAGVGGAGHWGCGVAVADYDADGHPDLFVTNFGPNALYRNRGDGTFENVAAAAGVEAPGWNTGAAFFDAEGDGDVDLFVAGYIEHGLDDVLAARRGLDWKGVERVASGPFGLPGAPDHFFRSRGDGTFEDATREAGLEDRALAFGFGARAVDIDDDGDQDLYVANDSDPNYLYRNEGDGTFREIGLWAGAAMDAGGRAQAGMGVGAGDVDGDGIVDLLVTNFSEDFTTLYRGEGGGFFEDASERSGIGPATYRSLSWGAALADLDNDGDLDLALASGHIYPQVDAHPEFGMSYRQPVQVLENVGAGRFVEATARAGPDIAVPRAARGLAAGDYDNDGDVDLLLTVLDGPPVLLRNDSSVGSWIEVRLMPRPGGGPLLGARIDIEAGGRTQRRDLASGDSYLSSHDPRAHFGLGAAARVERLRVRWPDGSETVLADLPANRLVDVRQPADR